MIEETNGKLLNGNTCKLAYYRLNNNNLIKEINKHINNHNKYIINNLLYLDKCKYLDLPNVIITNNNLDIKEKDIFSEYNIPILYIDNNVLNNKEDFNNMLLKIKKIIYESITLKNLYILKKEIYKVEQKYIYEIDKDKYIDDVINDILKLIKEKDLVTYMHVINVSSYVDVFVKGLSNDNKLSDEEILFLKRTALLHDIGKLIIPNQILKKDSSLTQLEYSVMKKHVDNNVYVFSSRIMNQFKDVVLAHHERYDGCGYGNNLSSDSIPYYARIISILDTFEAMSGKRQYIKNKKSIEEILSIINDNKGSQFDPYLTDIFINGITGRDKNKKLVLTR